MTRQKETDTFLADCEPYFLDGVQTIAEFVRRTQQIIHSAVDRHLDAMVKALGFPAIDIRVRDFEVPVKLQSAAPADPIQIGVCLKISDVVEAGFFRNWEPNEKPRICAYVWLARTKLDKLGKAISDFPEPWPEPVSAWDLEINGRCWVWRTLSEPDLTQIGSLFDELIIYFANLLAKVGGVQNFLN